MRSCNSYQDIKTPDELEEENALLKGRNEGFELQIMGLLIKYEEVYKRFPDLKSAMDKAKEVLKENAELKEFINAPHTKGRSTTRGDYIKTVWDLSKQLAEAKDLLKKLYKETRGYMNDQGFDMNVINEVYAFINSEVEK